MVHLRKEHAIQTENIFSIAYQENSSGKCERSLAHGELKKGSNRHIEKEKVTKRKFSNEIRCGAAREGCGTTGRNSAAWKASTGPTAVQPAKSQTRDVGHPLQQALHCHGHPCSTPSVLLPSPP